MKIVKKDPSGGESVYRMIRENGKSLIKDQQNHILFQCTSTEDGGLILKDAAGAVVSTYSALQLASLYRE
ncbi:MAG: hypothetical protein V1799_00055 [bacterium]